MSLILLFILCFFLTFIFIIFYTKIAKIYNLVDISDSRKIHVGAIPQVGGIAIASSFIILLFFSNIFVDYYLLIVFFSSFIILILGLYDDKYYLSPKIKILFQIIASLIVIYFGLGIKTLGVYNGISINLGFFGVFFTILCVIALINGLNFIDGVDGLCAMTCIISLVTILFYSNFNINFNFIYILIFSIITFIFFNLNLVPFQKIFLGDSGSTWLGYLIAWFLIYSSESYIIDPALLIWSITLPIFDFFRVSSIRIIKKTNPTMPDRIHVHHILLNIFNKLYITLLILGIFSISFSIMGFFIYNFLGSASSIICFLIFFIIYLYVLNKIEKNYLNFYEKF